jgi:hypothetical protein
VGHVFQAFKSWWQSRPRDTQSKLAGLSAAATVFEGVIAPQARSRFGLFCTRLRALDTAMLTPLILHLREHYEEASAELQVIITDLESYLVRRYVCGLTTKGYNDIFLRLLSELVEIGKCDALTVRAFLLGRNGESQVWPDDARFRDSWLSRELYHPQRLGRTRMLLEALERALYTPKQEPEDPPSGLSIEHVLPQGWRPETWPIEDVSDAARASRNHLLHTLGNLTLLTQPLNSSVSCGPFDKKRPEIARQSRLNLNAYFQHDKLLLPDAIWTEKEIVERGKELFAVARGIWPYSGE